MSPMRLGQILDVGINIFTRNFLTFAKIVGVLVVPVQIVSAIVLVSTISDPKLASSQFGSTSSAHLSSSQTAAFIGGFATVTILAAVLGALATAACFKAVSDAYLGHRPDWRASLSFALRRLHSVIWVRLLAAFLIFVPLVVLVGVGFALAPLAGVVLMLVLGLTAIWLYLSFALSTPVLLFEGVKGRRALARSFRLVRGRWWATFGTLVIANVLASILAAMVGGAVGALSVTGVGSSVVAAALLRGVGNGVGQVFTTPGVAAVTALVYYDLRVRKEGFDLQLMAERLGLAAPSEAAGAPPWAAAPAPAGGAWQQAPPPSGPPQEPPPSAYDA